MQMRTVRPLPITAGQTQYIDTARRGKHEATSLEVTGLAALASKLSGHLCQAFFEGSRLLQGVRRHCCQLRTICGMPFLVLHSLRPVCFACAVGGHIEGLNLVDVVVIHAPLGEDILTPSAELPVASVVGAGCEP